MDQAFWRDLGVILCFLALLVLFSSNFFDLGANFFGNQPSPVFRERFLDPWKFSSGKPAFSAFWQEGFLSLELVLRKWGMLYDINLISYNLICDVIFLFNLVLSCM
jgi:hypothetical protein